MRANRGVVASARGVIGSTAAAPTLRPMTIEVCHCCQAIAPAWSSPEYRDWQIVSGADGELLGVVCVGCLIDDELIVFELESLLQPA
jgi:hypothetical protein